MIKIEDPASGGDVGRYVPPYAEGEDSLFFETFNRNKKSVSLDLRSRRGREVFEDSSRRPTRSTRTCAATSRRKLGSLTTSCASVNPRIVCCSLSGFGDDRPARGARAATTT